MAESVPKYLEQLLTRVPGLEGVIITDRDGVPVMKVSTASMPATFGEPHVGVTFSTSSDQAAKMGGLGKNRAIVTTLSSHQLVQYNYNPLTLTLVATKDANTGILLDLAKELQPVAQQLSSSVKDN